MAAYYGHIDIVALLLKRGADTTAKDRVRIYTLGLLLLLAPLPSAAFSNGLTSQDGTARDNAVKKGHAAIVTMLDAHEVPFPMPSLNVLSELASHTH